MSEFVKIQIAEAFEVLSRPKRIKVFFGGRGAAKSVSFAKQATLNALDGRRFLCAREFQNSIDDSVHALLAEQIDVMGFSERFDVQATAIYGPGNSAFKFVGLSRNIKSIKSKHNFDVMWVEEAEDVPEKTWDIIIPTLRKSGSELWVSFNPADETDATYQLFVAPYIDEINRNGFYEDDNIYVRKVSMAEDNPWPPKELVEHSASLKATNYKKWLHVYGGEPGLDVDDPVIEPEWVDAAIDAHVKLRFKPRGERVATFDPADSGKDAKAVSLRHGVVVEDVQQWTDGDVADATSKAFDMAFEYRSDGLVYDNIGLGAGAVKTYLSLSNPTGRMRVDGFGSGDGVEHPEDLYRDDRKNKDTFKNKRAQYWWYLRDRFENSYKAVVKGEYIDPDLIISLSSKIKDLPQLKSELCKQQRKRTPGSRLIQLVSKEEMRADGIKSPNMADTLMMSWGYNPKDEYDDDEEADQTGRSAIGGY